MQRERETFSWLQNMKTKSILFSSLLCTCALAASVVFGYKGMVEDQPNMTTENFNANFSPVSALFDTYVDVVPYDVIFFFKVGARARPGSLGHIYRPKRGDDDNQLAYPDIYGLSRLEERSGCQHLLWRVRSSCVFETTERYPYLHHYPKESRFCI
jgi:hypothetical protein